jgi:uridine kinase
MLVIGIAGGTGSGKTTVVNKILQQLNIEGVNVLSGQLLSR